jgi:DNA-binding beta-propeller fold protein YncE
VEGHFAVFICERPTTMNRRIIIAGAVATPLLATILLLGFLRAYAIAPGPSGYHVLKTIPIGGDGGWDYCTVDSRARRMYISHATHVVVLDADTGAIVGDIPDTEGVHGIALAPDLGRGFVSDGRTNSVTIFDLKSLKVLGVTDTGGQNPDAIFYDAGSKRVFAFNGGTGNVTVINGVDGSVVTMFPVGGKPEFAAGAGDGHVFVNIEDKSELLEIDAQKPAALRRWPLAPCTQPSGLAMDAKHHRLFAVCDNNVMAVVNSDTGAVIATPKIGDGPDAAGFDPRTGLAFSSNGGSGTLTVVREDSPDKFTVVEDVPTKKYARTMAIDYKTHNIFLPVADFEAVTPPGQRRPPMKANSFEVLLAGR